MESKMSKSEYLEKLMGQINLYDWQMALEYKKIAALVDGDEIKQAKALLRQMRTVEFLSNQYQHIKYGTPEALYPSIKDLNDLMLAEYGLSQEKSALKILSFSSDEEFVDYLIQSAKN